VFSRPLQPLVTFLLSLAIIVPAPAAAQESSAGQTFTSNSELVIVPVQVLDHFGQPVRGLKQQDFVLNSDGNPQHISIFEEMQLAPAPPPVQAAPAPPPLLAAAGPPPNPNPTTFTNRPEHDIPVQLTIVAIDLVNTPLLLQTWARNEFIKYLKGNPLRQPVEVVAITSRGVRQVHALTTNNDALIASIKQLRGGFSRHDNQMPLLSRMDQYGGIDTYGSIVNQLQERQAEEAAQGASATYITLHNFEELAWAYSGIPGRKTVLWLTTGFPIEQMVPDGPAMIGRGLASPSLRSTGMHASRELLPAFQRAFTALNKANVMVYPIDVQGLPLEEMWDISQPDSLYSHPELKNAGPPLLVNRAAEDRAGMKELAHRTGGKTCTAGNNLIPCINQALGESSDYYLLGFYVPQAQRKLGWHKLKVTVNADHGEVRSRNTYFLRALGVPPEQEQEQDLRGAINASIDYTGIFFTVQPGAPPSTGNAAILFNVAVPPSSLILLPGENKLSFDVICIPLSAKGTPIDKQSRITKIDMTPDQAQIALAHGWHILDNVSPDSSLAAVKVVIRDNYTGRIGSVTFPVPKGAGS
jgi:VWFA-related protein